MKSFPLCPSAPRTPQRPPAAQGEAGAGPRQCLPSAPAPHRRPAPLLSPSSGAAPAALWASSPAHSAPSAGCSAMGTARRVSRARAAAEYSAGRSRRSSGRMPGRGERRCPPESRGVGAGLAEPARPSGKRWGAGPCGRGTTAPGTLRGRHGGDGAAAAGMGRPRGPAPQLP